MLSPASVLSAAHRLRGITRRTQLRRSDGLSALTGMSVYLKCECEQITGAFKLRGAFNTIALLSDEERRKGVVTSSAGNHGMGLAWAARHFGVQATVFVPATAPRVKRDGIAALGATVNAQAAHYDEALDLATAFAAEHGSTHVHPERGDPLLAGQGTIALEIIEELPDLATFVVPVGGGGLLGGCAALLDAVAPQIRIVGTQSDQTAAMARSLEAGRIVPVPVAPTLADGLAGAIEETGFETGRRVLDDMITVTEDEIAAAIAWLWREEGLVVEGSGAVGVAALRSGYRPPVDGDVAVVLTGGNI
ncbi:MAG: threonine ammonia-lyase, partial [Gemmatimonadaceae bacterium]